ncbi:sortase [Patescibacteria group bacterium]|nr:sortase [Patescibacteria group bacterium]
MNKLIRITISGLLLMLLVAVSLSRQKQQVPPVDGASFPLYPMNVNAAEMRENIVRAERPARIQVPSVSIDIAVKPAQVKENAWEFHDDAVSFWEGSARPTEEGNIVIYAHRDEHFQRLSQASIGEKVLIDTDNERFSYTISGFRVVSPGQMEVFAPTESEQLTILTCTNENDADRLVIIAKPAAS